MLPEPQRHINTVSSITTKSDDQLIDSVSPIEVIVSSQPSIDYKESITLSQWAFDEHSEDISNTIVVDHSFSEESVLDEDFAHESAKVAEGKQINDLVHQESQTLSPLSFIQFEILMQRQSKTS